LSNSRSSTCLPTINNVNEYTVVNGNTNKVCEFDSHTTTKYNTNTISIG